MHRGTRDDASQRCRVRAVASYRLRYVVCLRGRRSCMCYRYAAILRRRVRAADILDTLRAPVTLRALATWDGRGCCAAHVAVGWEVHEITTIRHTALVRCFIRRNKPRRSANTADCNCATHTRRVDRTLGSRVPLRGANRSDGQNLARAVTAVDAQNWQVEGRRGRATQQKGNDVSCCCCCVEAKQTLSVLHFLHAWE